MYRGLSTSNTKSLQGVAFIITFAAAAAFYLYQGGYFPVIQVTKTSALLSVQKTLTHDFVPLHAFRLHARVL